MGVWIVKLSLRRIAAALVVVPVVALTVTPASAAPLLEDLGTLPGHTTSQATSIRNDGIAVGYSAASSASRGGRTA
jgi:hypothetical protein